MAALTQWFDSWGDNPKVTSSRQVSISFLFDALRKFRVSDLMLIILLTMWSDRIWISNIHIKIMIIRVFTRYTYLQRWYKELRHTFQCCLNNIRNFSVHITDYGIHNCNHSV